MTTDDQSQLCPECAQLMRVPDKSGAFGAASPSQGDLVVCAVCLSALLFDADLLLQPLTDADWQRMGSEGWDVITRARRAAMAKRKVP
jgi:hypothetical protein